MQESLLIQVDVNDNALGAVEKMKAHREGILHRAFSIFLFNSAGHWLLQRRAAEKYHSGGLWTNACCGHPLYGENIQQAAINRLRFEMGLTCPLEYIFSFTYRAELDNGLVEHEYDHVFIGKTDESPRPNAGEVSEWKYMPGSDLHNDVTENASHFTEWFKLIYEKVNNRAEGRPAR